MPYQGHLVCGIRCNTEEEVRDFYKGLGVTLQNDYEPFEPTEFISFRDTQIDILEKISPHKREELEKIVEKGIGRWEEKGWEHYKYWIFNDTSLNSITVEPNWMPFKLVNNYECKWKKPAVVYLPKINSEYLFYDRLKHIQLGS